MTHTGFPAPGHDHSICVESSMERARAVFAHRGERMTTLREAVLRTIAESHTALGAYDIIDRLREKGRAVAPVSIYRILELLLDAELVHRIESRNAFFACQGAHDSSKRPVLFLVCEECGTVGETSDPGLAESLNAAALAARFALRSTVLEVSGLCRHCSG